MEKVDPGCALVSQALVNPEKADMVIENLVDLVTPLNDPSYLDLARSGQARIGCMRGQREIGLQLSSDVENMVWWLESPAISNCRAGIAQGTDDSLAEARTILHEALAFLKEAVIFAKPGGWLWPFIEPGQDIAELLMRLIIDDSENEYVRQILSICAPKGRIAVSAKLSKKETLQLSLIQKKLNLVDPFTSREIEILLLLEQRYSNKEIGEELYIGIETVKSHLKSIYSKLNVGKRKEAVIAAQRIGLFDEI